MGPATAAACSYHGTTSSCAHPDPKSMCFLAFSVVWLKSAFHCSSKPTRAVVILTLDSLELTLLVGSLTLLLVLVNACSVNACPAVCFLRCL